MGGTGSREYDAARLVGQLEVLEKSLDAYAQGHPPEAKAPQPAAPTSAFSYADLRTAILLCEPAAPTPPTLPQTSQPETTPAGALRRQSLKNAEHNKGQPPTPAPPPKERGAAVAIGEATESPPVGLKTVESKSCFKRKHPAQERRASDPRVRAVVEAPKSGGCDKTARKEAIAALKQKRGAFLAAHSWSEATPPPPGDVRCSAISSAALAISETMTIAQNTDIDISLQDIFYTLKLPLHHVTLESHTMPEVYDIINKYLAVAEETAISNFRLEFATCDTKIPREESDDDEEEEEEEQTEPHTVEQGRHLTLMDLQKELGQQFATTPSSYIFNYDPYVIQEARILSVLEEEEEDDDDDPAVQKLRQEHFDRRAEELRTVTAVNQGAFAILTGYNASLSEVQLATVHHTLDGLRLTTETTTLATLFRACSVPDLYTQRARGFVRVECSAVAPSPDSPRKTREWFTVSQVEATGNRRMPLELVDPSIYGALVAGGFAVHLYNQKNTGGNAPDEIVCPQPGVAVTEMFNTLNLPLEVLMRPSLRSSSTAEAYSFLREFVSLQGNARKTFVGIMCIKRKGGTSDGAVNFEESDLRQQVQEVDESEGHTVMIVNFDPVKLHHVPGVGESHFGVIVGYSAKRQTVNIADVSPKVFKKVWRVSLARLWEAMVGFGYVLLSPNHGAYGRRVFQSKMDFQNQAIDECGISKMPPHSRFVSFDFPLRVYCVTVMALGLSVLKGEVTTVEEVIRRAGWHMSFLLSDHLSLGDFVRVLEASAPDVACTPVYLDVGGEGALLRTIQESQRDGVELVVNFSAAKLSSMPEWYIGSYGGSYALLESYNEMSSMVVLTTAAAEKSRRTFSLPLDVLQSLCAEVDSTSGRSRGVVKMSKKSASAQEPEGGAQTLAQTANLLETPIPHPFKLAISPQVAGIAFALSTLGMKVSPEEVLYGYSFNTNVRFSPQELVTSLNMETMSHVLKSSLAVNMMRADVSILGIDACANTKEIADMVRFAAESINTLLMVSVNAGIAQGFTSPLCTNTCGLITAVTEHSVTIADVNPTKNGPSWTVGWSSFQQGVLAKPDTHGVIQIKQK